MMFSSKHQFITPEISRTVSLIVFLIFSAVGVWIGHQVGRQFASDGQNLIENVNRVEISPGVEQTNILAIITSTEPSDSIWLRSAWLIIYFPKTSESIFLPVYPDGNKQSAGLAEQLEDVFSTDQKGYPVRSLFDALDGYYQWDHFIVFDEETLASVIDSIGGVFINGRTQNGPQTLETLKLISQDPTLLSLNQAAAIVSVCQKIATLDRTSLEKLANIMLDKSARDEDLPLKMTSWLDSLNRNRSLKCEFPTLMGLQYLRRQIWNM